MSSLQDADDVIEIMKCSMCDTSMDEFGMLDFQRSSHGSGMSKKAQAKRFISELHRIAESTLNSIFTKEKLIEIMIRIGIQVISAVLSFQFSSAGRLTTTTTLLHP